MGHLKCHTQSDMRIGFSTIYITSVSQANEVNDIISAKRSSRYRLMFALPWDFEGPATSQRNRPFFVPSVEGEERRRKADQPEARSGQARSRRRHKPKEENVDKSEVLTYQHFRTEKHFFDKVRISTKHNKFQFKVKRIKVINYWKNKYICKLLI